MKLTKAIFIGALALPLMACAQAAQSSAFTTETPSIVTLKVLTFLESHQIRFDARLENVTIEGFSVKSGNGVITSGVNSVLDGDLQITGTPSGKTNIYVCYETEGISSSTATVHEGIATDKFGAFAERLCSRLKGLDKLYLCITDVKDGWNHDLSPTMNSLFNSYTN